MKHTTEIESLLSKYLDGSTTVAEEQTLHQYFARTPDASIPSEWRCYKALFAFHESEKNDIAVSETETRPTARIVRFGWWSAAAASVALVIYISLSHTENKKNVAYIDGVKTSNTEIIQQNAEQALAAVSISDEELFSAIDF